MIRDRMISKPEWRAVVETIPALRAFLARDGRSHGLRALVDATWSYLGELAASWQAGSPFVWYNLGFTPEVVLGLEGDSGRLCIQLQAALQSVLGDSALAHGLIDAAEAGGVPSDCCSADKCGIGAILRGLYPEPACLVGINTPCDSQVVGIQAMAELTRAPLFVIDVPYHDDERTVPHVAAQLRDLVPFLERHTGLAFDWDRFRAACERSNAAIEALWDWLELRRRVPLVQSSKLVAFTLVHQVIFAGTDDGVELARALALEARERAERGERFFEERVRAIWYQDPVWTDFQIYDWMERELGLTVPVDVFGYYAQEGLIETSSPESMLDGLARKLVRSQPMARQFRGDFERYLADFMRMYEEFRADCGIFAGHVACKHAWGGIGLFREACRRAGIPLLVFEFDMFDARVTPRGALQAELARFVNEVVWPKKVRLSAGGWP